MEVLEVPDWIRATALVGVDGTGSPQIVLLDAAGNIQAVMRGDDAGTLRTIAVDSSGQLYTLIRGSGGEDIAVDADGNLAALMKGIDGVTLRTVAVDGSGNIVAVIKGDYAGTLKTLATDAYGHLQVVPFDPDDIWGYAIAMGNAELVACLVPVHRYDRRGNVVTWSSFDQDLSSWQSEVHGTGAKVRLTTTKARSGAYACKLIGGSDGNADALIYRFLPYPGSTRTGVEYSFTYTTWVRYIELWQVFVNNLTMSEARVRYDRVNTRLEYFDSAGSWQTISEVDLLFVGGGVFHTWKLVVDVSTGNYVRLLLDADTYDLSSYGMRTQPWVVSDNWGVYGRIQSQGGYNPEVIIDDFIVTQNEPAN